MSLKRIKLEKNLFFKIAKEQERVYGLTLVDTVTREGNRLLVTWHVFVHFRRAQQKDNPYVGGRFEIVIRFPDDYPFREPRITFATRLFHPYVNSGGGFSSGHGDNPEPSVPLYGNWSPKVSVPKILVPLLDQTIGLMETDEFETLAVDIERLKAADPEEFLRKAREWTKEYASVPIPETTEIVVLPCVYHEENHEWEQRGPPLVSLSLRSNSTTLEQVRLHLSAACPGKIGDYEFIGQNNAAIPIQDEDRLYLETCVMESEVTATVRLAVVEEKDTKETHDPALDASPSPSPNQENYVEQREMLRIQPIEWLQRNFVDPLRRRQEFEKFLNVTSIEEETANRLQAELQKRLPDTKPRVVMSYSTGSRTDRDSPSSGPGLLVMAGVVKYLDDRGISCYTDQMTTAGGSWKDFFKHVQSCEILLAFLTKPFFQSGHCLREVAAAIELKRRIIPLRVESHSPSGMDIARDVDSMWPDSALESFATARGMETSDLKRQRQIARDVLSTVATHPSRGTILSYHSALEELHLLLMTSTTTTTTLCPMLLKTSCVLV